MGEQTQEGSSQRTLVEAGDKDRLEHADGAGRLEASGEARSFLGGSYAIYTLISWRPFSGVEDTR